MNTEQQTKVISLKTECSTLYDQVSNKIDDLCNSNELSYIDASILSHIGLRFKQFITELNDFELNSHS